MKILTNIDLNKNELQNAVIQNLAADPSVANSKAGQLYYNTVDNQMKQCIVNEDGDLEWIAVGSGNTEVEVNPEKEGKIKINGTAKTIVELVSDVPTTATGKEVPYLSLVEDLLDDKVDVDGDTMTGDLKVDAKLEATGDTKLGGKLNVIGDSNFVGKVELETTPTTDKEAATKKYVDDEIAAAVNFKAKTVTKLPPDTGTGKAEVLTFYFLPVCLKDGTTPTNKYVEYIFNKDATAATAYTAVSDGETINWGANNYFFSPIPMPTGPVFFAASKQDLVNGSTYSALPAWYLFKMPTANSKWTYLCDSEVNLSDYIKKSGGETKDTILTFTKAATPAAEPTSGNSLASIVGQIVKNEDDITVVKRTTVVIPAGSKTVSAAMGTIDTKYVETIRTQAQLLGTDEEVILDHYYNFSTKTHTFSINETQTSLVAIDIWYLAKQK